MKKWSTFRLFWFLHCCIFFALHHGPTNGNNPAYRHDNAMDFRKISVENGLSQSTVNRIFQDSRGFIWVGTRTGGLNKYDGYDFSVYSSVWPDKNSLSDNEVLSILEDQYGYIWVGTRKGGLNRLDPQSGIFQRYGIGNVSALDYNYEVSDLLLSDNNTIWVGSSDGLYYFDELQNRLVKVLPETKTGRISRMARYGQDRILISSRQHLVLYDTVSKETVTHSYELGDVRHTGEDKVVPVLVDYMNNIWVGSVEGLVVFGLNTQDELVKYEPFSQILFPLNTDIRTIHEDRNKNLWFGTYNGLLRYQADTHVIDIFRQDKTRKTSMSHNSIMSFLEDAQGNLWIGTWGGGINFYSPWTSRFQHIEHHINDPGSLSDNVVSAFAEDKGGLWVGTEQGGLNYFDSLTGTFRHWLHAASDMRSLSSNHVKALLKDSRNQLWVGTFGQGGLNRFDRRTYSFDRFFDGLRIFSMAEIPGGNIWLGTMEGLYEVNHRAELLRVFRHDSHDSQSLGSDIVLSVFVDRQHRLWIATKGGGLNLFDPEKEHFVRYGIEAETGDPVYSGYVFCLAGDLNGNVWVGSSQGLSIINADSGTLTPVMAGEDLPDLVINGIVADHANRLWVASNKGLSHWDPENGLIQHYDHSDGLQSNEFNRGAYFRSTSGKLFFGGINGFNAFCPHDIKHNPNPPRLHIKGVKVFDKPLDQYKPGLTVNGSLADQVIKLNHHQTTFTIEYVALNYVLPEKTRYAYMLEGYDTDWVYTSADRTVSYMNLPHGIYNFRLKAANNNGVWTDSEIRLGIRILPSFLKTPYAYLLLGVVILILLFVFRQLQVLRIKQRNLLENERREHRQMEELHQVKLGFLSDVTYEIKNPLTLIATPLNKLQKTIPASDEKHFQLSVIEKNVNKIASLIDQLTYYIDIEHNGAKLSVSPGDLYKLTADVISTYQVYAGSKGVDIQLLSPQLPFGESWFDPSFLEKILSNFLSYALMRSPNGGQVTVSIRRSGRYNEIQICDQGKSLAHTNAQSFFIRDAMLKDVDDESATRTGIGLAIAKKLVDLHRGNINMQGRENSGAEITLIFPAESSLFAKDDMAPSPKAPFSSRITEFAIPEGDALQRGAYAYIGANEKIVLIVEDNIELSNYLASQFDHHRVFEARDGKEGLGMALSLLPDIIISDVMMPEMDGFALCEAIKSNFITSHIPVILLTAKSAMENKIHGLETGADAYIEKPFNLDYLFARVDNLLMQRNLLKLAYSQGVTHSPDVIKIPHHHDKFLKKVSALIAANIDNPDFSVEQLCEELGLSRSQLFRKFNVICDSTPGDFIRTERLNYAIALMAQGDLTINEVCYRSGFSNPSYFITLFKKHFGKTPGEYARDMKNNS
jgi:ligand-binding sensor domain-containing protein/signal transduction histidine kinase/AraC-like DNA-binding protein/ActR/RegA family two-component response regulator